MLIGGLEMTDQGKGSRQRDVDRKKWEAEYDRIFKERYPDTPKKGKKDE